MLTHLADVSIRSLLLALPAAIGLWVLRSRRTAALQHAVWAAVVCGMLALFAFGQVLPRLSLRILYSDAVPPAAQGAIADRVIADESLPVLQSSAPVSANIRRPIDWKGLALYAYCTSAFAFLAQFVTGMFLVRKLAGSGRPIPVYGAYESDRVSVPVTVGWLRPRVLLPPEWREWEREKLDAVLAHEGAHVRRRDALVAALAGVNRSLFWFHPLAWMLERKLALLADQACDEACVAMLGDRDRYARLLLEMALVVDRSQGRLRRQALTMAAGSHIRQRIEAILQDGRTFSRGPSWTGWAALTLCGIPVVFAAGAVELDRRPPLLKLDIPHWTAPAPALSMPRPVVQLAQVQATPAQPILRPASAPKFDRVSIKPCGPVDGAGRSGRGGAGGRGIGPSPPGEIFVNCLSVREMLDISLENGNDRLLNDPGMPNEPQRIRGGPAWILSDLYTIDAQSSDPAANIPDARGNADFKLLSGPMLRGLLEDRFQLKTHRAVEVVPMYALTVANSGFKLQPMEEGGCIPHDPTQGVFVPQMFPPGQRPLCVMHGGWAGPNWTIDAAGQGLGKLAGMLSSLMVDRYVLDKTGITGVFIYHLVFAHDKEAPGNFPPGFPEQFPPSDTPPAPSISTVLDQLGLKLMPDSGPHEYVVIDSVERPSEN
jgi:uncharacterized protein (TIGR03435 family)